MPRNPKVRVVLQRLVALGCRKRRSRGSHERWVTPGGRLFTFVAGASNADVTRLVRTSVERALRQEGLSLF